MAKASSGARPKKLAVAKDPLVAVPRNLVRGKAPPGTRSKKFAGAKAPPGAGLKNFAGAKAPPGAGQAPEAPANQVDFFKSHVLTVWKDILRLSVSIYFLFFVVS